MAQFKWGGTFTAIDSATQHPVTGSIGGEFTGEYPAGQEPAVKAIILSKVNDVLGGGGSIEAAIAVANFPELSKRIGAAIDGPLAKLGVRGSTTVAFAKRR